MGDRQDIDALLIGALYGELDGAGRARLEVHLRSHPADRTALDALESTRALLADVGTRDLLGAAEPPSAVSARLLQEAARRAPAPRSAAGGVLAFLTSLLRPVAAHPALSMAAAALLVVGAGTMMMKQGSLVVAPRVEPSVSAPAPPTGGLPAGGPRFEAQGQDGAGAGDVPESVAVGLADSDQLAQPAPVAADVGDGERRAMPTADDAEEAGPRQQRAAADETAMARTTRQPTAAKRPLAKPASPTKQAESVGLRLDKKSIGQDVALKDLDRGDDEAWSLEVDSAPPAQPKLGAASPNAASPNAASPNAAAPNAVSGVGRAPGPGDDENRIVTPAPPPSNDAWARDEHTRMVKLVAAGRCTEAGQIGATIARRAPEYYQSAVVNDRAVRSCKAYVDQARRAKAPAKPTAPAPDQAETAPSK